MTIPKHAILVHGMGRTPLSMLRLAARLRRTGLLCHLFAYVAAFERFDSITARLARRIESLATRPYVAVGHSLGGLLLRAAIGGLPPHVCRPEHLFLLGTPNHSPRLARRFQSRLLYRLLSGDSGRLLADSDRIGAIARPEVATTLIAGTRGWKGTRSTFGAEENDGLVAVSEVHLDGLTLVRLPLRHTFMMNAPGVADLIERQVCQKMA